MLCANVSAEVSSHLIVAQTQLLSKVLTGIYDEAYRPFGVNAPRLILLSVIFRIGPASRAEIASFNKQDRSTLTRHLKPLLAAGWIEERKPEGGGRARPLAVTQQGKDLLLSTVPTWHAAQKRALALLGEAGTAAIMEIGDGLMDA